MSSKFLSILFLFFILSSCTFFAESFDNKNYEILNMGSSKLGIAFSHNINGETHPCGCRHHPLGGLPQVAGVFKGIKDQGDFLYVDTGDTFFASSTIPKTLEKSLFYNAENLALGLEKIGLRYFVPGDQDFAGGWKFLKKIADERSFHFLLSNLADPTKIKHKEWALIEKGPHKIFLLGFTNPSVLPSNLAKDFISVKKALKSKMELLKKNGWDQNSPFHRLIVLSHSGIDYDEKMAESINGMDWIIGAHSQSFFKNPLSAGKTKIGQVLSRNHYVGEITISLDSDKKKDRYQIHETRDQQKDKLKPNPFIAFIDNHKAEVGKLQKLEQSEISTQAFNSSRINTATSCLQCHDKQGDHWLKTPHSLAYATLINAKEESNLACIKCHSVGLNSPQGFRNTREMTIFDDEVKESKDKKSLELHYNKYMEEFKKIISPIKSVRGLSSAQTKVYATKLIELERKHKVAHNFSGVQCMNCHDKHFEHPFEPEQKVISYGQKIQTMKKKCLECHDPDQSPGWYHKNKNGLPGDLDKSQLDKKFKAVSCPKRKD